MNEESKCECQRCGQPIVFPIDLHNTEAECPHCHKSTTLLVPSAPSRIRKAEAQIPPEHPKNVAGSTIGCSYALAFLLPIAGFFAGIYLMAKKETGHGVAVMALSIIVAIVAACIMLS